MGEIPKNQRIPAGGFHVRRAVFDEFPTFYREISCLRRKTQRNLDKLCYILVKKLSLQVSLWTHANIALTRLLLYE